MIVQADPITQAGLATVVVMALSSQDRPDPGPAGADPRDRRLRDSFAMADQPRSLERAPLGGLGISLACGIPAMADHEPGAGLQES